MPSQSNKTKLYVGIFVTVGFTLALIVLVGLGVLRFFEKGQYYLAFFDESVQGLDRDSAVKYRGVSIGRVESIDVAPDQRLIQVLLKIETDQKLDTDIVAQLKSVGITGSVFVELDRMREGDEDKTPDITFMTEYPVVATKPSELSEILKGVDDVVNKIRAFDLEGISERAKISLDKINTLMDDVDVKTTSENINRLIDRTERTIARVDAVVAKNEKTFTAAFENLSEAVIKTNSLLDSGADLVHKSRESVTDVRGNIMFLMQDIERSLENLNRAIDIVSDQPSQLFFGKPPPARKLPEEDRP